LHICALHCHCEERSDAAIFWKNWDPKSEEIATSGVALLAMTRELF